MSADTEPADTFWCVGDTDTLALGGVGVGDKVGVGVLVGVNVAVGVGDGLCTVTEPPSRAMSKKTSEVVFILASVMSMLEEPSASVANWMLAMVPSPDGPAPVPVLLQVNVTPPANTSAAAQTTPRPVDPRNGPSLALTKLRMVSSQVTVKRYPPRSTAFWMSMSTLTLPGGTVWSTGQT